MGQQAEYHNAHVVAYRILRLHSVASMGRGPLAIDRHVWRLNMELADARRDDRR